MATEEGDYQVLEKPTFTGWTVKDLHTKERRNLDLIKEMTEMLYIGRLHDQTEDGIHIINDEDQIIFLEKGAYNKKIFFTTKANYQEDSVFVVNVPRSKHGEPACVKAKQDELRQYENLNAFEVIDISEAESKVIATEWTIIEEQDPVGVKKIKARLCLVGNMKESLHKICKQIPTVSNKTLKILLSVAVSQGWEIRTCDVEKAFLQSDEMQ